MIPVIMYWEHDPLPRIVYCLLIPDPRFGCRSGLGVDIVFADNMVDLPTGDAGGRAAVCDDILLWNRPRLDTKQSGGHNNHLILAVVRRLDPP